MGEDDEEEFVGEGVEEARRGEVGRLWLGQSGGGRGWAGLKGVLGVWQRRVWCSGQTQREVETRERGGEMTMRRGRKSGLSRIGKQGWR